VALTFDDGPGTTTTRQILHVLRGYKVHATFFDTGQNIAANPTVAREQVSDGYAIGDHTWSHPDMTKLSRAAQAAQIDEEAVKQRAVTGTSPCLFRPPYGNYNTNTLQLAKNRRMAVWLWSVDTEDWKAKGSGSPYWVNRIIRLAEHEGIALHHPVILMHNQPTGNRATVLALPAIIKYFRQHHYRFVKLT
jgi:peptidoglycan/xylan/chitin deacetylase (PgdA/CDA1 family)